MTDLFRFADELGPEKILHIYQPSIGLRAIVVIDNCAAGPGIGGVRMAPDVSVDECFRLARAMTLKNAAAGLPHGGGKSVIFADPGMDPDAKQQLIRAFGVAIAGETRYIPGPDMGTNETAMAWMKQEGCRVAGLPRVIGGIPLDEIGATGFGLCVAAKVAAPACGLDLKGARLAVQGFGAVGTHAARFLAREGAILVAASDSRAMVQNPDGLNIEALIALKRDGQSLGQYQPAIIGSPEAIIGVDCDIWIPAARPDVLDKNNAGKLRARLVLQGANIPATPEAEDILHQRRILCIPDFIANAGGVICAAIEYHGGTEAGALQAIEEKISTNTSQVLEMADGRNILPRAAAEILARERIDTAMHLGRWFGTSLPEDRLRGWTSRHRHRTTKPD